MGRPPLPIGAHGNIKMRTITRKDGSKVVEARCRFRHADGQVKPVKRVRKSQAAAENAVKDAVIRLTNEVRGGEIRPETRFRVVAEAYYAEVELQVAEGRKAPKTAEVYRSYLDVHLLPALGELRMQELDAAAGGTSRCEALMAVKRKAGAKDDKLAGIRNVINNVCSFAVRHGALTVNPVREMARLQRAGRKKVRALTVAERLDLLAKLAADKKAAELDLADVLRGMLATGVRVSEMLGCCGDDVLLDDPKKPRVVVEHRTSRIKGTGIVRRPRTGGTKGDAQELRIPQWSVGLFRERKLASGGAGPLFGDRFGKWRSNDSVTTPLREALDRLGYEWVTSHVMRKTVAAVLKEAGLPVRDIADQLGQASSKVTEDHYLERHASNDRQVEALERMFESGT